MPVPVKYPGVYIEEVPSGVRTIVGVSTATTAFVGRARKGPVGDPIVIHSFTEYERFFGGLWPESTMSIAVNHYFANGGSEAVIVRVYKGGAVPLVTWSLPGPPNLEIVAASPGTWAKDFRIKVDHDSKDPANLLNLTVLASGAADAPVLETIRNVSLVSTNPAFITRVLAQQSEYIRVGAGAVPPALNNVTTAATPATGDDGATILSADVIAGLPALDKTDIFNLLVLPPPDPAGEIAAGDYQTAATYCAKRRAMLLVDPTIAAVKPQDAATKALSTMFNSDKKNAAVFYPRIKAPDPFNPTLIETYPPTGAIAGVFARTDAQRGVWKAPAGLEATLAGVQGLSYTMTDGENGDLNPLGINCLRTFPFVGQVVWGARTMEGTDALASEWKYVPVRRIALYIEESLYRGLKWVVFEPNDEPLWAQIRLNVGAFMNNLFRQGAFQGRAPREAYFVKCDRDTTTQTDINLGIVNVLVGFAPLKPAEFVIIKIQQMAGQIAV